MITEETNKEEDPDKDLKIDNLEPEFLEFKETTTEKEELEKETSEPLKTIYKDNLKSKKMKKRKKKKNKLKTTP